MRRRDPELDRTVGESGPRRFMGRYLSPLTLLLILVAWELAIRLSGTAEYLLPAPTSIAKEFANSWDKILANTWDTLKEIAIGYVAGVVTAVFLGILISTVTFLERALMPLLVATDAVPKIAIAPLLLLWFGTGMTSKVILVIMVTFFPILITTITGMRAADRSLLNLFQSVGASRKDQIVKLRLPYAIPYIFAGLKVATTLSVIGAIIAEWVSSSSGLGHLIIAGITNFETTLVFACIVVLIAISLIFFHAIDLLGKRVSWQSSTDTPKIER